MDKVKGRVCRVTGTGCAWARPLSTSDTGNAHTVRATDRDRTGQPETKAGHARGAADLIYTLTDEAPMLATHAFLPVIRTFAGAAGIAYQEPTRHLGLRRAGGVPGKPDRRAARARQSGRTGRTDPEPGHQHHQVAQHQQI